jgi:hypothetical protein
MDAVLVVPPGLGCVNVGELLALPGKISEQHAKRLTGSAEQIIRTISSLLDELVAGIIEKRTATEFSAARDEVFVQYFSAIRALSDLVRIVVPKTLLR